VTTIAPSDSLWKEYIDAYHSPQGICIPITNVSTFFFQDGGQAGSVQNSMLVQKRSVRSVFGIIQNIRGASSNKGQGNVSSINYNSTGTGSFIDGYLSQYQYQSGSSLFPPAPVVVDSMSADVLARYKLAAAEFNRAPVVSPSFRPDQWMLQNYDGYSSGNASVAFCAAAPMGKDADVHFSGVDLSNQPLIFNGTFSAAYPGNRNYLFYILYDSVVRAQAVLGASILA